MSTAVLVSGGLDSAVLLAEEAHRQDQDLVQPIYVRVGLAWEAAEQRVLEELLRTPPLAGRVRPLATLTLDMRDVYRGGHWAVTGHPPGYHTADEDVYLAGRNITLFAKAGIYCAAARINRLVVGSLAHNPFPDATDIFRASMAGALSLGLAHVLTIDAPYALVSKADVIGRGATLQLPLQLTLSCMRPEVKVQEVQDVRNAREVQVDSKKLGASVLHCGLCSKCRERHDAFLEAGRTDPTHYADLRHVGQSRQV